MKKGKKILAEIFDETGEFFLYQDNIVNSEIISKNAIEFKIPPANSGWVMDLFKILTFMMKNYAVYVSGEHIEINSILLVNTSTMI